MLLRVGHVEAAEEVFHKLRLVKVHGVGIEAKPRALCLDKVHGAVDVEPPRKSHFELPGENGRHEAQVASTGYQNICFNQVLEHHESGGADVWGVGANHNGALRALETGGELLKVVNGFGVRFAALQLDKGVNVQAVEGHLSNVSLEQRDYGFHHAYGNVESVVGCVVHGQAPSRWCEKDGLHFVQRGTAVLSAKPRTRLGKIAQQRATAAVEEYRLV
mmetsp:Transcript_51600/g.126662  ORF Transcript_51600/g.126662 Transcript_51600/m.126662 type:complete len:218 (-) Transcript_51600:368-1021(-)